MPPKKIIILGSTGNVGRAALAVVDRFPEKLKVVGLSANHQSSQWQAQLEKYQPLASCLAASEPEGLVKLVRETAADLVVVAVVGAAGIAPTLAAIETGKNVALATKEVLVIAGKKVLAAAKKNQVTILPLDSEHSAMFQALQSGRVSEIEKVYLTMGTGRIAKMSRQEQEKLTPAQVLQTNHWVMGQKITLDSATCVNKIFEAIEAAYFFSLRPEQIQIVVHPEYVCHSLVEFRDGSIIGEFGSAQMERYLQYGLLYPERHPSPPANKISLLGQTLSFLPPDVKKFPVLQVVPQLLSASYNLPAVFHGADESCTQAFLAGKLSFPQIGEVLVKVVAQGAAGVAGDELALEKYGQELATQIIEGL
jgi:1-deoxy-D-xylulose-5-phosphate reductoisomerase